MTDSETDLLDRARFGDRQAFDALVQPHLPMLRGYVRRMVTTREDTDDVIQEVLLKALTKLGSYRGESKLSSWLFSIATRQAIDHLRSKKRYRVDAQEHVRKEIHGNEGEFAKIQALMRAPEHRFDAREHIAFCFSCVARSLDPEEQAALILRDVFEYKGQEAATASGMSESTLRHRLTAARRKMIDAFDGLCGIVNKNGVCHQCRGLREFQPEQRQGPPVPNLGTGSNTGEERYRLRLPLVQEAEIDAGVMQAFHDSVWRALDRLENR